MVHDPILEEYYRELETQTDRGFAVLAAAFLEWRTRQVVESRFTITDSQTSRIFGRLGSAEIGCLAYGLGLIGPNGLKDLELVGKVRNKFAHRPHIQSFDHPEVTDLCKLLTTPTNLESVVAAHGATQVPIIGNKKRFALTAHQLSMNLWAAAKHLADPALGIMPEIVMW
jgi:hypothetical protein